MKDCIEENTCFVATANSPWEINSSNTTALHACCTFRRVRNRLQPQTSLWNYEKAMLIKIVAMFRKLLIYSFDATIRVKMTFIYFKTCTSNHCEVTAMHGMRPIDGGVKSNFKEKYLSRVTFAYQKDKTDNTSTKMTFSRMIHCLRCFCSGLYCNYFSIVATENSCQPNLCRAYDFFVNSLTLWRNSS